MRLFKPVTLTLATLAVAGGVSSGLMLSASAAPALPAGISLYDHFRVIHVRSGQTLSDISREYCGTSRDYPSIAAASGILDANYIVPGERIVIRCYGGDGGSTYLAASVSYSYYSYTGLERLWERAGGPAWAAADAACIAEHESGGYVYALSFTGARGLWQIEPGWGYWSSYSPAVNARGAVVISDYGRDWDPWTTAPDCGL